MKYFSTRRRNDVQQGSEGSTFIIQLLLTAQVLGGNHQNTVNCLIITNTSIMFKTGCFLKKDLNYYQSVQFCQLFNLYANPSVLNVMALHRTTLPLENHPSPTSPSQTTITETAQPTHMERRQRWPTKIGFKIMSGSCTK